MNGKARVLIAAGGSGGHIFPAVALAHSLRKKGCDVRFVGSGAALDKRIFQKEGFPCYLLTTNKMPYRISLGLLAFFIKAAFDMARAFIILADYRPHVIAGFGGYVSGPIVLAGWLMEVPSIIHEQNAVPGRSNAMFFRIADRVAVSFEETVRSAGIDPEKAVVTGNPIRAAMFKDDKEEALNGFGLAKEAFTILVIGGSQGARSLNDAFLRAIAKIDKDMLASLQIIHITGVRDYSRVTADYEATGVTHRVFSFIDRIEDAYSAADLVITRAGASAIFEIAFFGRPMILVPYPLAMSHQASNAGVFADRLAAVMIRESGSLDEALREKVSELFGNRDRRRSLGESARRMSIPEAAENLAGEVLKLARKG